MSDIDYDSEKTYAGPPRARTYRTSHHAAVNRQKQLKEMIKRERARRRQIAKNDKLLAKLRDLQRGDR